MPAEPPASRFAAWEGRLGRLFLVLLATGLALVALDWLVGLVAGDHRTAFDRQFPVGVTRMAEPYVAFGGRPNAALRHGEKLNALGYRGPAPDPVKPEGETRVFILGGSTVFNGDPTIPALVQAQFENAGCRHVRVYNFGVVSSVSGMELSRLVHEVAGYSPDLVVLYNGHNDIMHPFVWDPRPGYPFNFIAYEHQPLLDTPVRDYPSTALWLYGSHIARSLFSTQFVERFVPLAQTRTAVGYGTDAWRAAIADIYVENLLRAKAVSHAFGASFIAFFQPAASFKEKLETSEADALRAAAPGLRKHFLDERRRILARVASLPASTPLPFVDLGDIYRDEPGKVFIDHAHTVQSAKPVVAERIYREIVSRAGPRLSMSRCR